MLSVPTLYKRLLVKQTDIVRINNTIVVTVASEQPHASESGALLALPTFI